MSCALRTKIDYVEELGVDISADLLLAYDNAVRDHYAAGEEKRIRAGLDATERALEAH
jgi:hypothetical protein